MKELLQKWEEYTIWSWDEDLRVYNASKSHYFTTFEGFMEWLKKHI